MPFFSILAMVFSSRQAGPSVQMIFVLRIIIPSFYNYIDKIKILSSLNYDTGSKKNLLQKRRRISGFAVDFYTINKELKDKYADKKQPSFRAKQKSCRHRQKKGKQAESSEKAA